ncbi:hypothetical protein ULMS_27270 [Patiriisocius marinistellae]|uniref:Calcineurin-like phosphoesterase domain-containing protein n=1 Tax=Patiriisocius marinistellae TaxID=2494560 RepID=A0A5J4G2W4_9FLAO|nr:metallophosphoesterase [Patiriisocius marinistellae]GEQ87219.1 hypothetical protein ULMS_27270 [Patiriisocius marinistellae]
MNIKLLIPTLIFLLCINCTVHKMVIADEINNPIERNPTKTAQVFYIVGNASTTKAKAVPVLDAMQSHIAKTNPTNPQIIFTGDNINGSKKDTIYVKKQLDRHLDFINKVDGTSYMIPGNYDWDFNKTRGLEFVEEYLNKNANQEDILVPKNGAPLKSIEVNDAVQMIIVDSQWYILNWYLNPEMNDKSEIKSREKLLSEIKGELKKNANKTILFVMHHPMFTNGLHGGRFSFRDHIFPLGGDIPLPGIATLITQIRSQGGIAIQDRFNAKYRELMEELQIMLDNPALRTVLISGHEENLQYIEQGNIKQVISGAGSDVKPVNVSDNGLFSYGQQGFSTLEISEENSVFVSFFGNDMNGNYELLFKKEILPKIVAPNLDSLPERFPKSFKASVYKPEETEKTDYFESFWGNHYRAVYGTEVTANTAILDTLYGGLEVMRKGGGHQTKSLRLKTKDGKEYNMRALKKSAVQFLETTTFQGIDGEVYFDNTIPANLISDFYTAAHPYGAFAIPTLAKAAQVYYTTPELFYVPQQKALGKFNEEFGDALYMIVERPTDDYLNKKNFGYPDDVESTDDLLEKLRRDESYTVNEPAYIKARIFDMLIGDWDRHSDQWRWAEIEVGNDKKEFLPIPRDRDQVFANFDGEFLDALRAMMGTVNQFGVYGEDIGDIKWFNEAGSKLDRALIKRSGKEVWIAQAKFLQNAINENIIDDAFSALPEETQGKTTQEIKEKLLLRKANLVNIVERYYTQFSKFQMLTGTDKDDLFEIERKSDGVTNISAYRIKDGEKGDVLFERSFSSETTEEIWLYGLDDKDVFKVSGDGNNLIKMHAIGGQNNDTFDVQNGKKIYIYDHRAKKNTIEKRGGANVRLTKFYEANIYDYKRYPTESGGVGLAANYNPDDGTLITAEYSKEKNNFLLNPYSSKFYLKAEYASLTQGIDVSAAKYFASIFSDFNLVIDGRFTSKNYTENFFGFGNETNNFDELLSIDFNRVNLSRYKAGAGVERTSQYGSYFQIKFDFDAVEFVENGNNFIKQSNTTVLGERSYYAIPSMTYVYSNFDNTSFTSKGMEFRLKGGGIDDLNDDILTGFIDSHVSFYNSLLSNNKLILNTQVRSRYTFGDRPQFFQNAQLGADNGLRGYRNQRFTGDGSLAGRADLIYNFEKIKTFLFPLTLSAYVGYDIGKVWVDNQSSNEWHDDYGGGFVLKWTEAIQAKAQYFQSKESGRFEFGFALRY